MKKPTAIAIVLFVAGIGVGGSLEGAAASQTRLKGTMTTQPTTLGAFSVGLAVKNLEASRAFYEKLDFKVVMGDAAQNWLILRNGNVTFGLFQGVWERNVLTFNPGWDDQARAVEPFTDIREHQRRLKASGLVLKSEADDKGTGPANFMLIDPDGNPVIVDQHVSSKPR